jgi:outer membrane immunogenic protein
MKKIALSLTALALTAASAFAADLPSRKGPPVLPPPPPPPPLWTGFYAGLNAGYGFGTNSNVSNIAFGQPGAAGYDRDWDVTRQTTLGAGGALTGFGGKANQSGFIGGGQVGYNYQWGQSLLVGLEADMQGTGIRGTSGLVGLGGEVSASELCRNGSAVCTGFNNGAERTVTSNGTGLTTIHTGVDWLGTVRGRLGWLFTPTMLVYATGGLTYGGVYANVNNYASVDSYSTRYNFNGSVRRVGDTYTHTFIGGGQQSNVLVGWNVGGGLEWMFMPSWSLKAEAIYWNMGNSNIQTVAFASAPVSNNRDAAFNNSPFAVVGSTRVNYQGVIARAGINYHFNWGSSAPVVAQY